MERRLNPTGPDIEKLMNMNQLAQEQLKGIILERLLAESEARVNASTNNVDEAVQVADSS